jgi:hypothetical protein
MRPQKKVYAIKMPPEEAWGIIINNTIVQCPARWLASGLSLLLHYILLGILLEKNKVLLGLEEVGLAIILI